MKRLLPKTLPGWFLIILISGLALLQVLFVWIVASDRAASDQIVELYRVNERANWIVKLLASAPRDERAGLAAKLGSTTFAVEVAGKPAVPSPIAGNDSLAEFEDILVGRLAKFGVIDARIKTEQGLPAATPRAEGSVTDEPGEVESHLLRLAKDFANTGHYTVSLQLADGAWINFAVPITPTPPMLAPERLPLYSLVALVVIALSIWAIWTLTSPYLLLEKAVTQLGKDIRSPPVPEIGSPEYRSAARAINAMQSQILEYVEDREYLAAALAHDLRTPMTRMRLRLELMRKSDVRDALSRDISNLEHIVSTVLEFAKLQNSPDTFETLDLRSFTASVTEDFPEAEFQDCIAPPERIVINAQPVALRRVLSNLVENAIKYGKRATVTVGRVDDMAEISICDEGSGIPDEMLEQVFRPFKRVDASRNSQTGGYGLGLTIARALARKMNGDIVLSNLPGGGLRARLSVPLAKA